MIKEDVIAERIVIDSYREMILCIGNDDPTTRRLLENMLAKEEEQTEDLISLLKSSIKIQFMSNKQVEKTTARFI